MVVWRNSMSEALSWRRVAGMDVLDDLLAGTRARGGVFNLTIMDPPWALHICDEARALPGDPRPRLGLGHGGTASSRCGWSRATSRCSPAPRRTSWATRPETAPQLRIHPGGVCEPLPGAPVDYSARLGVRTHGGRAEGEAMVVSGTYQLAGDVSQRLLAALPSVLVVPAADVAGLRDGHGARRDPARRTGPAERARPMARSRADHHAAGVVRPARVTRAGLVPGAERSGGRPGVAADPRGSGASVERRRTGRTASASPGPAWPGASPRSSARPR